MVDAGEHAGCRGRRARGGGRVHRSEAPTGQRKAGATIWRLSPPCARRLAPREAHVRLQPGLSLGDALVRCHALDDQGLYWFEEPTTYDNIPGYAQLARELKTPVQLGENFYGAAAAVSSGARRRGRLRHARPDAHRRRQRVAACRSDRRAPPAFRCPRTSTRRSPRISCVSPRPRTGSSGRIGPTRYWRSRSSSKDGHLIVPGQAGPGDRVERDRRGEVRHVRFPGSLDTRGAEA